MTDNPFVPATREAARARIAVIRKPDAELGKRIAELVRRMPGWVWSRPKQVTA